MQKIRVKVPGRRNDTNGYYPPDNEYHGQGNWTIVGVSFDRSGKPEINIKKNKVMVRFCPGVDRNATDLENFRRLYAIVNFTKEHHHLGANRVQDLLMAQDDENLRLKGHVLLQWTNQRTARLLDSSQDFSAANLLENARNEFRNLGPQQMSFVDRIAGVLTGIPTMFHTFFRMHGNIIAEQMDAVMDQGASSHDDVLAIVDRGIMSVANANTFDFDLFGIERPPDYNATDGILLLPHSSDTSPAIWSSLKSHALYYLFYNLKHHGIKLNNSTKDKVVAIIGAIVGGGYFWVLDQQQQGGSNWAMTKLLQDDWVTECNKPNGLLYRFLKNTFNSTSD